MIKFGVVGTGPWGQKVAKAIDGLGFDCQPCDRHGAFQDYDKLLDWADIVWIATRPGTNCDLAARSLEVGCPTVVEKPVAFTAQEVRGLVKLSKEKQIPLIVDYLYLFNTGLTRMLGNGRPCQITVGEPPDMTLVLLKSLAITMANNNPRNQYSALWDWGSHAASIALDVIREPLTNVSVKHENGGFTAVLLFGTGVSAYSCVMRLSHKHTDRIVQVDASGIGGCVASFVDERQHAPLQALISTIARLHLCGEYWTNGDLAVEVTDLLERLHKMLPT